MVVKIVIDYSFYGESKSTKEEARNLLKTTEKPILYTFGFKFRNPTTKDVKISNESAVKKFDEDGYSVVKEYDEHIDFNQYGEMDMW